jgi:hypothetical protein
MIYLYIDGEVRGPYNDIGDLRNSLTDRRTYFIYIKRNGYKFYTTTKEEMSSEHVMAHRVPKEFKLRLTLLGV